MTFRSSQPWLVGLAVCLGAAGAGSPQSQDTASGRVIYQKQGKDRTSKKTSAPAQRLIKSRNQYLGLQVTQTLFRTCSKTELQIEKGDEIRKTEEHCPGEGEGPIKIVCDVTITQVQPHSRVFIADVANVASLKRGKVFFYPITAEVAGRSAQMSELKAGDKATVEYLTIDVSSQASLAWEGQVASIMVK